MGEKADSVSFVRTPTTARRPPTPAHPQPVVPRLAAFRTVRRLPRNLASANGGRRAHLGGGRIRPWQSNAGGGGRWSRDAGKMAASPPRPSRSASCDDRPWGADPEESLESHGGGVPGLAPKRRDESAAGGSRWRATNCSSTAFKCLALTYTDTMMQIRIVVSGVRRDEGILWQIPS